MSALVIDTKLAGSFLHIAIGKAPSSQRLSTIEEAMLEPEGALAVPPRRATDIAEFGLTFAPGTCQCFFNGLGLACVLRHVMTTPGQL